MLSQEQKTAWENNYKDVKKIHIQHFGDIASLRYDFAFCILSDAQELTYLGKNEQARDFIDMAKYFMLTAKRMDMAEKAPKCPSCAKPLINLTSQGNNTFCCECHALIEDRKIIADAEKVIFSH